MALTTTLELVLSIVTMAWRGCQTAAAVHAATTAAVTAAACSVRGHGAVGAAAVASSEISAAADVGARAS